jgi:DNA recombination protein RmuC
MVKPIREALDKTEKQLRLIENERKEAYGSLTRHLHEMAQTQQLLQGETRNLVKALRRPEVRGQWGEMTLKRLAELAGMVEHCDFFEQEHTQTDEGGMRPDMIVRMPDGREIVVDVKTPLDAYLDAVEASDDKQRELDLDRHARNVRNRVRELASKSYWSQFKNSPDFVVLFIPGDQFLSAALEKERDLLEFALQQKVILSTPTSFVALLRAVAYGWRQEILAENADKIREVGEELYKRLATFVEHMGKVGKSLGSSLDHYNKAVGSLERQLIPGARKLAEMGIQSQKTVASLEPLEKSIRALEAESIENLALGSDTPATDNSDTPIPADSGQS